MWERGERDRRERGKGVGEERERAWKVLERWVFEEREIRVRRDL